jgi:alkanesulfonate monooxygenase SsuD/methylene tetrahydromethanopterin reductase-like flavin-dependent oxidoreductase (luciferase family)
VVLPAVRRGAEKAGRDPSEIDRVGAPFLAIAKDEAGVVKAMQALKQHIAFYASTRTYHSVLEYHGWMDVGAELHRLSKEGKWTEMPNCISDEMLQEWAIIGTWDQLVSRCQERCDGIFDTVLLDLPPDARREDDFVRETIQSLRQG